MPLEDGHVAVFSVQRAILRHLSYFSTAKSFLSTAIKSELVT